MSFTIRLLIWFKGRYVGKDSLGNSYYEEKHKVINKQSRRWVIYSGHTNKVPPEWHAWLHYHADHPEQRYYWQDPNQQKVCKADSKVIKLKTKSPYQPWKPNE